MNNKLFLLLVLVSVSSLLNSTIWHIKQDGTGNFSTIQEGIIASSNADTILVYPGIYFENIDYLEKSITLASLYLTTGNDDYISQTIIDGNQSGSCVEVRNCTENYNTLCGFTLRNGTGNQYTPTNYGIVGGGILLNNSVISINNCIIKNNFAEHGGGINCIDSTIHLLGTVIKNNRAYKTGGGISIAVSSEVYFDENELCNIYLNYSSLGSEIHKIDSEPLEVIVDTFTVMNPDEYFISSINSIAFPQNDITLSIQNTKLEPINANLYVSADGNNVNSGLTADEPLATINYAYSLIQPDSLENNTIHIADGEYSTTLNDQWFPLQMRGYINLIGESMNNTIFDAETDSPFITDKVSEINYTIKNLTLENGYGVSSEGTGTPWSTMCISDAQWRDKWVILENIKSYNCEANSRDIALWFISAYLKNVHIYDNLGNANVISSLAPFQSEFPFITVEMRNCSFKNCDTDGLYFGFGSSDHEEYSPIILNNVEITNNFNTDTEFPQAFSAIIINNKRKVDMINCTIGNNTSLMTGGAIGCVGSDSELNIYNSILHSNDPIDIWIGNDDEDYPFIVNIHNSLIEYGEFSISNNYNWNIVNWFEGNLEGNPYWQNSGDYPYMLTENSPCINAGTLDLPAGIELPEFDLAGNPRIYGETIDMGAYEFQGDPQSNNENEIIIPEFTQISNYPNPFNPSTTIKLNLAESGNIELAIYNIKGQKVKTLMDAYSTKGHFEIIWRGIDDNKRSVASGNYFIKLKVNGEEKAVSKCILLK